MPAAIRSTTATRLRRGAGIAALALVASPQPGPAQSLPNFQQEWRWVDFGPESGLPAGGVVELVEVDSVVWIRTDRTVAWYDGFRWITALADGAPLPAPVTSLAADSARGVLVAAGGRIYQGGIGGLRELAVPEGPAGRPVVRAFPAEAGGGLLVAAHPAPTAWILRNGELTTAGDAPPILAPREAWITRKGTVWINSVQGLLEREGGQWVSRAAPPPGESTGALVTVGEQG
ncbi:MAG: hypothetical protein FIA95_07540, partial [Gemmatimonadetes bacterium]|nr:hypothetical protein [Gemmatimonadota bacterium]